MPSSSPLSPAIRRDVSPSTATLTSLFGGSYGQYDVRPNHFLLSFVLHGLIVVLLAASTRFVVVHRQEITQQVINLVPLNISEYFPEKQAGGGGGGDLDKIQASKGGLPRAAREQFTPPAVRLRNENPKLPMEPTIVAPPELKLPAAAQLGDPFNGALGPLSNGRGSGGGIGDGRGTGVGPGRGAGAGPGEGGGLYTVGGNVSAPRVLYDPDPDFSDQARRARFQGTVLLWLVVGTDGRAHDVRVARSLGMGLDEQAVAAVNTWRFDPARLNGRPVPVQIQVAVSFQLH